jgi:hypothetical protein
VAPSQYLGARFQVTSTMTATSMGGHFLRYWGGGATETTAQKQLFGAIVALSGPTDFPDSDTLNTPDVKLTTLIQPVLVPYEFPRLGRPDGRDHADDAHAGLVRAGLRLRPVRRRRQRLGAGGRHAHRHAVVVLPQFELSLDQRRQLGGTGWRFFVNDNVLSWKTAATGTWSTNTNWDPGFVPASVHDVLFNLNAGSAYTRKSHDLALDRQPADPHGQDDARPGEPDA